MTGSGPRTSDRNSSRIAMLHACAAAAFLLAPLLSGRIAFERMAGYSRDERETLLRNKSAVGTILGEFRASMSDMMFIKTERYLDSGVAFKPHVNLDDLASSSTLKARPDFSKTHSAEERADTDHDHDHDADHDDHDHDHDHGKAIETVIRTKAEDFRGFIGWLEREVKPWRDPSAPHTHTKGTELLPWYRVMTLSDPHSIRAYLIGAFWLRELGPEGQTKALEFVDEGIKNNPDAFQLHMSRGYALRDLERDKEALPSFRKAADLAIEQRPPDAAELAAGRTSLLWTMYQEEDALASARMTVLLESAHGSKAEALRLARLYNDRIGGDAILKRQINVISGQLMSN